MFSRKHLYSCFIGFKLFRKKLNYTEIIEKLSHLMNEEAENEIKNELGNEYTKFITDLNSVRSNK